MRKPYSIARPKTIYNQVIFPIKTLSENPPKACIPDLSKDVVLYYIFTFTPGLVPEVILILINNV